MNKPGPRRHAVLGIGVDPLNRAELRQRIANALADPWDGRCRHVVTLNPEYVMAARSQPGFASAIEAADIVVADGIGVAIAARWLASSSDAVPDRVTGGTIVDWLAQECTAPNAAMFLLGAGPGIAEAAARELARRVPTITIGGAWSAGTAEQRYDEETLARIRQSEARVLLVAYGAPGQVLWIDRNRDALGRIGVRLAIGIGGTMDVIAGRVARPQEWMQRVGLEWVFRLVNEPWRWRRQMVLPGFALRTGLRWLWQRGNRARARVRTMTTSGNTPDRDQTIQTSPLLPDPPPRRPTRESRGAAGGQDESQPAPSD